MSTTHHRPVPITAEPLPATVTVTYGEAAELIGVSPDTVKRGRVAGRYPNAHQVKSGTREWRIPLGDLVAAGQLDASLVTQAASELIALREIRELRALRELVIRLETQLTAGTVRHAELLADKSDLVAMLMTAVRSPRSGRSRWGAY